MGSENDLMELLWRDGQIVTHNHSQWNPENYLIHGEAPTSWFQYSSGDLFEYNSNISYETPIDIRSSGLQSMNEARRVGNSLSMVTVGSSNSERNQVQVVTDVSHNSSDDGTSESGGSDFPFGRTEHFSISNQSQKRKMRNEKESKHHIEGADCDSIAANKMNQQSSSSERNRSNEVHNLSERRRRDKINEKMRALQELIPNCNKLDKASILDDAIEYLKSLQQQLQIMWSSSSMAPVMFPGGRHYIPSTGIGMSMGYVPFRGGSIASQMQMLPSQPIDPTLLNHRQLSVIPKSYGHYPQYQVPTAIASGKRLPTSGEYHSEFTLNGRPDFISSLINSV